MKNPARYLILLLSLCSLFSCQSDKASTAPTSISKEIFNQSYLISLSDSMVEKAGEEMDIEAKLIFSLLSPLKLKAHFWNNGYMKFDGDYGFFSFSKDEIQGDSIPFHYSNQHLFLGDVEDRDSVPYTILEKGKIALSVDSLEIILSPL